MTLSQLVANVGPLNVLAGVMVFNAVHKGLGPARTSLKSAWMEWKQAQYKRRIHLVLAFTMAGLAIIGPAGYYSLSIALSH